jgi:hypothetical protein
VGEAILRVLSPPLGVPSEQLWVRWPNTKVMSIVADGSLPRRTPKMEPGSGKRGATSGGVPGMPSCRQSAGLP